MLQSGPSYWHVNVPLPLASVMLDTMQPCTLVVGITLLSVSNLQRQGIMVTLDTKFHKFPICFLISYSIRYYQL